MEHVHVHWWLPNNNFKISVSGTQSKLFIDCGFARTAIRELSQTIYVNAKGKKCKKKLDIQHRANRFQALFPTFKVSDAYYSVKPGHKLSQFNKHCKVVQDCFNRRWNPSISRKEYGAIFSITQWIALTKQQQSQHSIQQCVGCATSYASHQNQFPTFKTGQRTMVTSAKAMCSEYIGECNTGECGTITQHLLAGLEASYKETFGQSFTDVITKCPNAALQKRKTTVEKKREKRQLVRKCVQHIQDTLRTNDATMVLNEGLSLRTYNRIHLAQGFESAKMKNERANSNAGKKKTHSPSMEENVTWDTTAALNELKNWSEDKKINWSQVARQYNIPGKNRGQVLKEFARKNGLDTYALDGLAENRRTRAKKLKMPGNEISMPCTSTTQMVKEKWAADIEDGTYSIGIDCAPKEMTVVTCRDGEVVEQPVTIYSRKVPMNEIRQRLLKNQEKYMRLQTDEQVDALSKDEAIKFLKQNQEHQFADMEITELRAKVKALQRNRHLVMWHDHGTILGQGYIFITVKVIYDTSVFFRKDEYSLNSTLNLQGTIEKPEVHVIGIASSSHEDQAALIPERVSCLRTLNSPIMTTAGIPINDTVRFFAGDGPARNFERGVQQGGTIRCGACGIQTSMTSDIAHALTLKWRTLQEQQDIIIAGKFGKMSTLKPFENLRKAELELELAQRGITFPKKTNKIELEANLLGLLSGFVRVPTLLLKDPCQTLQSINMDKYTILECEPLHDLKGHIHNLFVEVEEHFDTCVKTECVTIIAHFMKKETKRACDYRHAAILILLCLLKHNKHSKVCTIFRTIVEISEIMYSSEEKRTPRSILRLYNLTWIHATACTDVFQQLKHLTQEKFYGAYFHALTSHAAQQYEVVCLKSINTENEERIFETAKRIASTTSNRKPEQVLPNMLLRLQAGAQKDRNALEEQNNSIRIAAAHLPCVENTVISKDMTRKYAFSWQAHLNRIAPYLEPGEGFWWREEKEGYEFFDGSDQPDIKVCGPTLLHFRNTFIEKLDLEKRKLFQKLVASTNLPAETIRIYDDSGYCTSVIDRDNFQHTNSGLCTSTTPINVSLTEVESSIPAVVHVPSQHPQSSQPAVASSQHPQSSQPAVVPSQHPQSSQPAVVPSQHPQSSQPAVVPSQHPQFTENKYKTKTANAIAYVIGQTDEINSLDNLRINIKKMKGKKSGQLTELTRKYQHLLAFLKKKVQKRSDELDTSELHMKNMAMKVLLEIEQQLHTCENK